MSKDQPVKVLFVCMGNICRSPTAEGAFSKLIADQGLDTKIATDSSGTHAYHVGEPPDQRAQAAATKRDIDLSGFRGRLFVPEDFIEFDYIIAMDESNFHNIQSQNPGDGKAELSLFLDFSEKFSEKEVPDPYYGGNNGFERVLDMIEDASRGLLAHIRQQKGL